MPDIDISIIIPTYNRLWSLPKAIESCRNNACSVEIIVVDDGSTDGTWQWLEQQGGIVTHQQSNMGKCAAVNKAFEIASGKYVRFLDSDDMINPKANDEQFLLAETEKADIVVSGYCNFNSEGQSFVPQSWMANDDFTAQQLGEGDGSHYSAFLFRKGYINDILHQDEFAYRDDRLFILEAALKNPALAVHPGTALLHRVGAGDRLQNSSGLKQQTQNHQHFELYKLILNRLKASNQLTERRKNAALNVLWPLAHWVAQYDLAKAQTIVDFIQELKPAFNFPEIGLLGTLYKTIGFIATERLLNYRRAVKKIFY